MGVDIDIKKYLSQNKLTASQHERPVDQFDAVTQSTEQNNIQVLLQILNVFQRRLGERNQNLQTPLTFMLNLGDEQRLIIAFPRIQNQRQTNENEDRNRQFRSIARQIQNEQLEMNQTQPIIQSLPPIRPPRFLPEQIPNRIHNIHDRILQIQRQMQIELQQAASIPQISPSFNQSLIQSSFQLDLAQQYRDSHQLNFQINNIMIWENNHDLQNYPMQNHEDRPDNILRGNDSTLSQFNLNQNSKEPIKPQLKPREEQTDEPISCWQAFTRAISHFFSRFN